MHHQRFSKYIRASVVGAVSAAALTLSTAHAQQITTVTINSDIAFLSYTVDNDNSPWRTYTEFQVRGYDENGIKIIEFRDDIQINNTRFVVNGNTPVIIRSQQNMTLNNVSVDVSDGVAGGGKGGVGGSGGVARAGGAGGSGGVFGPGFRGRPGNFPAEATGGTKGGIGFGGSAVADGGLPDPRPIPFPSGGFGGEGGRKDIPSINGTFGGDGKKGDSGQSGKPGAMGRSGKDAVTEPLGDALLVAGSGGGGGGGGGGGNGGGGGGGGGAGGSVKIEFANGGVNTETGGAGGNGGAGGDGGNGGRGGAGGNGGGVFGFEALGRLAVNDSDALSNGSAGSAGKFGNIGGFGVKGSPGVAKSGPSGSGGSGGDGGFGGRGGDGGAGGAGSGGTISLKGSIVEIDGLNVNVEGPSVASVGRFVVQSNAESATDLTLNNQQSSSSAIRTGGPLGDNSFIEGDTLTPFLADLVGGVATSGYLADFDITDPAFMSKFSGAGDNTLAGLTLFGDTTDIFGADFEGYDLLVFANLSGESFDTAMFGAEAAGGQVGLFSLAEPAPFQVNLPTLGEFGAGALFATLIPEQSSGNPFGFNVALTGSRSATAFDFSQTGSTLAAGATVLFDVATVPVPAAFPLFGSVIAAFGIARWRRRRR